MLPLLSLISAALFVAACGSNTGDDRIVVGEKAWEAVPDMVENGFECGLRRLMMRFAPNQTPEEMVLLRDALQIGLVCGNASKALGIRDELETLSVQQSAEQRRLLLQQQQHKAQRQTSKCAKFTVGQVADSSRTDGHPNFESIYKALKAARKVKTACKTIELPAGITFLESPLQLGEEDSGVTVAGARNGKSWVSGGVPVNATVTSLKRALSIADASAPHVLVRFEIPQSSGVSEVPGLFGINPHVRFQRARWPNGDTERVQWGYSSPLARSVSMPASDVREWTKPQPKPKSRANLTFVDLSKQGNPSGRVKDDSAMREYNTYVAGKGGVCDDMWDTSYGSSYWCSDKSAGGWAEVDAGFAKEATVGLPVGLEYYLDSDVGARINGWGDASGAVVHAWHGQSWFTNMFEVTTHDKSTGQLGFGRGGSQGGRSWCRCDQCFYAASWCKRSDDDQDDDIEKEGHGQRKAEKDTRLVSGSWYVENVLEELDVPGEFYFDAKSRLVRLLLNRTQVEALVAANEPLQLVVPQLANLLTVDGANDVLISNLGFRDARYTYLEKHGVPSGGDWALFKGAALVLSNTERSKIDNCSFSRLDGTAVMLLERTRNVTIVNSRFEWLGESAMAAWGQTDEWDGRSGHQPRDTLVQGNIVREIGIYEKQSSAWFQAKACGTTLQSNTFFNLPRAAVNFNDGFGGGNLVQGNLMVNSCRESGDHGVINSWDRQPFLWDEGRRAGFVTPPTVIRRNFLVANYGASQGVDNDDGSSFYDIRDNINIGDGFKGDYGPHDSSFSENLVIVRPYDGQNCVNVAAFKPGHQHRFFNNTCVLRGCRNPACEDLVSSMDGACGSDNAPFLAGNQYFTKHGNATIRCAGKLYQLPLLQKAFPTMEQGTTFSALPMEAALLQMVKAKMDQWKDTN